MQELVPDSTLLRAPLREGRSGKDTFTANGYLVRHKNRRGNRRRVKALGTLVSPQTHGPVKFLPLCQSF